MTSHALGYGICLLNNRVDKFVLTELTPKEIHYAVGTMNRDCSIFWKYFFALYALMNHFGFLLL